MNKNYLLRAEDEELGRSSLLFKLEFHKSYVIKAKK